MALELNLSAVINTAGTIITLTDETGVYHAVDNPGGYGAPNAERADLALILVASLKETAGDASSTVASYSPLLADEWSITYLRDGWYNFTVAAITLYVNGTHAAGDVVYDTGDSQIKLVDSIGPDVLSVITIEDVLADYQDKVVIGEEDKLFYPDIEAKMSPLVKEFARKRIANVNVANEKYLELDMFITGAIQFFCETHYAEAQECIEAASYIANTARQY